jgi:hypothetical protein
MKRQISGRAIVNDLRSGMGDRELREKHGLSENSLHIIFKKLMTLNAITHAELCQISESYRERSARIRNRKYPRAELTIRVPVYELQTCAMGILRDISENGLRVAGIEARVGQAQTFQIPVDMYVESDPLLVVAECKWVEMRRGGKEYVVAGFEIMDLSDSDSQILRNFIGCLLLSESGLWQTID